MVSSVTDFYQNGIWAMLGTSYAQQGQKPCAQEYFEDYVNIIIIPKLLGHDFFKQQYTGFEQLYSNSTFVSDKSLVRQAISDFFTK